MGLLGAGFAFFLNHKRQKEKPGLADFLITTPRSSSKSTCCANAMGALGNCMKAKSLYHAIEIINPSQGAELTGSGRGVVTRNYRA